MKYGTHHYQDFKAACEYYRLYGYSPEQVKGKIERDEIAIGKPSVPAGAKLHIDSDGRYHIDTREKRI